MEVRNVQRNWWDTIMALPGDYLIDLNECRPDQRLVLSIAEDHMGRDEASKFVSEEGEPEGERQGRARKLGLTTQECSEAEHLAYWFNLR